MGRLTLKAKHRLMCGDSTDEESVGRLMSRATSEDVMCNLLHAAKAVIDLFDDNVTVSDCEHIDRLRHAVQQAEKAPADFPTWWEKEYGGRTCRGCAEDAWRTAKQMRM